MDNGKTLTLDLKEQALSTLEDAVETWLIEVIDRSAW